LKKKKKDEGEWIAFDIVPFLINFIPKEIPLGPIGQLTIKESSETMNSDEQVWRWYAVIWVEYTAYSEDILMETCTQIGQLEKERETISKIIEGLRGATSDEKYRKLRQEENDLENEIKALQEEKFDLKNIDHVIKKIQTHCQISD